MERRKDLLPPDATPIRNGQSYTILVEMPIRIDGKQARAFKRWEVGKKEKKEKGPICALLSI
jgi:hypothetical protein